MRRLRILQLGDIHYPDWKHTQSDVDAKDDRFSPRITRQLRHSPLRAVLKRIRHLCETEMLDAVAFMGDFTSRGKSEFLAGAFQHFSLLCRGAGNASKTLPLLAVPGNHDVNRKDALELGSTEKFSQLATLAERFGWRPIPINGPIDVRLHGAALEPEVTLINTSVGSWELQNLPGFLRDKLQTFEGNPIDLGELTSGANGVAHPAQQSPSPLSASEADYYGQLDTPYVSRQTMNDLMERLSKQSAKYRVLVGHHNVLPQKIPRVTPYAELLNSGFVRHQLLSLNKPIVYLHGHIHQDPIEVIQDPRMINSRVICISAPEISSGFNEIVLFISDSGELVGLRVIPYRVNSGDGTLSPVDPFFVSTMPSTFASLDEAASKLLEILRDQKRQHQRDLFFWHEVRALASGPNSISDEGLEDRLLLLHAAQAVDVNGLSRPYNEWRVQVRG